MQKAPRLHVLRTTASSTRTEGLPPYMVIETTSQPATPVSDTESVESSVMGARQKCGLPPPPPMLTMAEAMVRLPLPDAGADSDEMRSQTPPMPGSPASQYSYTSAIPTPTVTSPPSTPFEDPISERATKLGGESSDTQSAKSTRSPTPGSGMPSSVVQPHSYCSTAGSEVFYSPLSGSMNGRNNRGPLAPHSSANFDNQLESFYSASSNVLQAAAEAALGAASRSGSTCSGAAAKPTDSGDVLNLAWHVPGPGKSPQLSADAGDAEEENGNPQRMTPAASAGWAAVRERLRYGAGTGGAVSVKARLGGPLFLTTAVGSFEAVSGVPREERIQDPWLPNAA